MTYQPSLFDDNLVVMTSPAKVSSDETLLNLWLHGRGHNTCETYRRIAESFLSNVEKPLGSVSLNDLQEWYTGLEGSANTKKTKLNTIKSLLKFGHSIGYLPFNVGLTVKHTQPKDKLIHRIVDESVIQEILDSAKKPLDKALLRLLYVSGIRTSEACSLVWDDFKPINEGVVLSVYGKGNKTRNVLIDFATYELLKAQAVKDSEFVFTSQKGGAFLRTSLYKRVKKLVSGFDKKMSTHWFRHAHASHSLDNGAGLVLVQTTLGHASLNTTTQYLHAKPKESSGKFLKID